MSSIEERVRKIVCEQLGVKEDEVKPSASFVEDFPKCVRVLLKTGNFENFPVSNRKTLLTIV